ncbi:MAG: SulP family inorganic anion transporter [bacterium]
MYTQITKRVEVMAGGLRSDILAGFVVFLVALPLCMGISLASGAPVVAGLVSGVVAGIVVSWISGSELSVSGPAAGLSVTVAAGISLMGSFEAFLAVTILSGIFQILFSILRSGSLAAFFPNSVIKGMLAAIGLTIIFKQIPHALGWDSDYEGDESFFQTFDHSNTFYAIAESLEHLAEGAIIVAILGFLTHWLWGRRQIKDSKLLKFIPAPLMVVIVGVVANMSLAKWFPQYALTPGSSHMVNVPNLRNISELKAAMLAPDFTVIREMKTWSMAAVVAAIGSLETLLSIEAVDRMDPDRRTSDGNRELLAQGLGNIVSGCLGGLVMTSVIVRSSANIYAGAKSRLSSFFHGLFMLIFVLLFTTVLNQIPLAALAVVLIAIGYKLVSLKLIKSVWMLGLEQFIPFAVTLVAVVFSDLLTGVGIGLIVGLAIVYRMNTSSVITTVNDGDQYLIRFCKDVAFTHKPRLKKILADLPNGCSVIIDGAGAQFIDFDILEQVKDFIEFSETRDIKVTWKNLRSKRLKFGGKNGELQSPSFG